MTKPLLNHSNSSYSDRKYGKIPQKNWKLNWRFIILLYYIIIIPFNFIVYVNRDTDQPMYIDGNDLLNGCDAIKLSAHLSKRTIWLWPGWLNNCSAVNIFDDGILELKSLNIHAINLFFPSHRLFLDSRKCR